MKILRTTNTTLQLIFRGKTSQISLQISWLSCIRMPKKKTGTRDLDPRQRHRRESVSTIESDAVARWSVRKRLTLQERNSNRGEDLT